MSDEIHDWTEDLASSDATVRAAAVRNLASDCLAAQAVAVSLVQCTGDDDEAVREAAVDTLENLGAPRPEDVARLAGLLDAEQGDVAYWSATLLGRCGEQASAASKSLNEALEHPKDVVRQRAAWALGKIGPRASCALPSLSEAAASADARLARYARQAIEKIKA